MLYQFDWHDASTVTLGKAAPHTLTAFLNLVCPDTRRWWLANEQTINRAVQQGQLQVHLKFWNKPKAALVNGNIAQTYIDYRHPQRALAFIEAIFADQDGLRELAPADVATYLTTRYHVSPYSMAEDVITSVTQEVRTTGVTAVPTFFLDDQKYTAKHLPLLQSKLLPVK